MHLANKHRHPPWGTTFRAQGHLYDIDKSSGLIGYYFAEDRRSRENAGVPLGVRYGRIGTIHDGSPNYVDVGNIPIDVSQGTMLVWCDIDTSIRNDGQVHGICEFGNSGTLDYFIGVRKAANDTIIARYRAAATNYSIDVSFPAGERHQIGISWDSDGTVRGIRDGQVVGSTTRSADAGAINQGVIGARGQEQISFYYVGFIDLVLVFSRSLNTQEILAVYKSPYQFFRPRHTQVWVPVGSATIQKSAADSIDVGVTEAVSLLSSLSRSDTVDVSVADGASMIAVVLSAADPVDVTMTDMASQLSAVLQRSDTLDVGIADVYQNLYAMLSRTDTVDITLADTASILVMLNAADALDIGIADAMSLISIVLSASDTVDVSVQDTAGAMKAILAATDSTDITLSDTAQALLSRLQRSDTLDVALIEGADLRVAAQAVDTMDMQVTDQSVLTLTISVADTVSVSLGEASLKTVLTQATGHLVGAVTVRPSVLGNPGTKPAVSGSVDAQPAVDGKPGVNR